MKTVKISASVKSLIDGEGTYDAKVNQLMDRVGDGMPSPVNDIFERKSIINLSEGTVDRLKCFRLSEGESLENIIIRFLLLDMR